MNEQRRDYLEGQALLGRERHGSWSTNSEESYSVASDLELDNLEEAAFRAYQPFRNSSWFRRPRVNSMTAKTPALLRQTENRARRKRSRLHRLCRLCLHLPYLLIALLTITALFFPSYTHPPEHYTALRHRVYTSHRTGSANPLNERIFIAASLYDADGSLLRGHWGQSVLHLIDVLGHENVFLSLYENDPSEEALLAMSDFRGRLPCASAVVHESLDLGAMPHVVDAEGKERLKRMAFLADVRNRALRPLDDPDSEAYATRWDKLLYLNDIAFDPIDAANLLLSTNLNPTTGRTDYRAACAVDFINSFKFYDTFATRDSEGFEMGVPFFPWFTDAGEGRSRREVLEGRDAVGVRSCWGGMVAFEGKWFQGRRRGGEVPEFFGGEERTNEVSEPLRFRAENETYWDASECCLIHADLAQLSASTTNNTSTLAPLHEEDETRIYLNPFVRVAYVPSTLRWLQFTRRFEKLYPHIHTVINFIGRRPGWNPRRAESAGEKVERWVWREGINVVDGGEDGWVKQKMQAGRGGFCGMQKLFYLKEGKERSEGGENWGILAAPPLPKN